MAVGLELSDALLEEARRHGAAENRSAAQQIEYWARIGKAALESTAPENGDASPKAPQDAFDWTLSSR